MAGINIGNLSKRVVKLGGSLYPKMYLGDKELGSPVEVIDWDTYENGIWQESPNHESNVQYTTGGFTTYGDTRLKSPATNASTWGDYIIGWWSYSSRPTASLSGGYTLADADPYVAVWDCVLGQWLGVAVSDCWIKQGDLR